MEKFSETSLIWGLAVLLLIAAVYGLRAVIASRTVARDAAEDYDYKVQHKMVQADVSQDRYIRAYRRFNAPRAQSYMAVTLGAIAVLTLPALGILNFITVKLWELNGKDEVFAPGFLVHALLMFFLIIFFWAFVAYVAARHYHKHTPISLQDEITKDSGAS